MAAGPAGDWIRVVVAARFARKTVPAAADTDHLAKIHLQAGIERNLRVAIGRDCAEESGIQINIGFPGDRDIIDAYPFIISSCIGREDPHLDLGLVVCCRRQGHADWGFQGCQVWSVVASAT